MQVNQGGRATNVGRRFQILLNEFRIAVNKLRNISSGTIENSERYFMQCNNGFIYRVSEKCVFPSTARILNNFIESHTREGLQNLDNYKEKIQTFENHVADTSMNVFLECVELLLVVVFVLAAGPQVRAL